MSGSLHVVALSGGIATGKSSFCQILRRLYPDVTIFDADQCVAELYANPDVVESISGYFGAKALLPSGDLDKGVIRQRVFSDQKSKEFLESLFHPLVRKECLALLADITMYKSSRLFVADIPLLFESGFDFGQSANLLVATSSQTQIDRLRKRNTWDEKVMEAVIASQLTMEAKSKLADIVFWNEGSLEILEAQCGRYLRSLEIR